jgi:hypothetical protein
MEANGVPRMGLGVWLDEGKWARGRIHERKNEANVQTPHELAGRSFLFHASFQIGAERRSRKKK